MSMLNGGNGRKRRQPSDASIEMPPSKRPSYHSVSVKCLVPHQVAGKLLGKGGDRMRALKEIAPKLFMSKNDEYFPNTDERVLFIGGTLDQVLKILSVVQEKILELGREQEDHIIIPKWRLNQMKIVVANSTCSKVIGKDGEVIKHVRESTETKITTTPQKQIVGNERVITIAGEDEGIMEAIKQILKFVEEDRDAKLQNDVSYKRYTTSSVLAGGSLLTSAGSAAAAATPASTSGATAVWPTQRLLTTVLHGQPSPGPGTVAAALAPPPAIPHPWVFPIPNPAPQTQMLPGNPLEFLGAAAAGLAATAASGATGPEQLNNVSMIECLGGLIAQIARQQRMNGSQNGTQ